jgi:hypothetical protein
MTMNKNDSYDDFDDFNPDFLPGDDEIDVDAVECDMGGDSRRQFAWQKIEQRRDMAWLKDQTADWDYWDDYLHTQ